MSQHDRVRSFMVRFGQHVAGRPTVPPDDVVRNRCKWQLEETLEFIEACFPSAESKRCINLARAGLAGVINCDEVKVDLVAYADANADIRYVAYGNDVAAGIDGDETDLEVAASNDSKSAPSEPGGKVQKGAHYKAPRIAALLEELGWKKD